MGSGAEVYNCVSRQVAAAELAKKDRLILPSKLELKVGERERERRGRYTATSYWGDRDA